MVLNVILEDMSRESIGCLMEKMEIELQTSNFYLNLCINARGINFLTNISRKVLIKGLG